MRILIVEPECDGHHFITYVKFILRLTLSKKIEVILLTSSKTKDHLGLKIIKKLNPTIKIVFIKYSRPKNYSSFNLLLHQIKLYFIIKKNFLKFILTTKLIKFL